MCVHYNATRDRQFDYDLTHDCPVLKRRNNIMLVKIDNLTLHRVKYVRKMLRYNIS